MTPAKTKRIEAIRASIAAWEKKRDESDPREIHIGVNDCPLCVAYRKFKKKYDGETCGVCPVKKHTGMPFCDDTPFEGAWHALSNWRLYPRDPRAKPRWITAAQAEIDFLKMLEAKELAK